MYNAKSYILDLVRERLVDAGFRVLLVQQQLIISGLKANAPKALDYPHVLFAAWRNGMRRCDSYTIHSFQLRSKCQWNNPLIAFGVGNDTVSHKEIKCEDFNFDPLQLFDDLSIQCRTGISYHISSNDKSVVLYAVNTPFRLKLANFRKEPRKLNLTIKADSLRYEHPHAMPNDVEIKALAEMLGEFSLTGQNYLDFDFFSFNAPSGIESVKMEKSTLLAHNFLRTLHWKPTKLSFIRGHQFNIEYSYDPENKLKRGELVPIQVVKDYTNMALNFGTVSI